MDSLVRFRAAGFWLCFVLFGMAIRVAQAGGQTGAADRGPQPLEVTLRDDAALSDVCFVGALEGWAVGDRGVVWHTRDGGATWEQQDSHVACSLSGVFFLDKSRGWAVGGASRPFTRATTGVVLQTTDGGATWTPNRGADLLPAVTDVRFFNAQQGLAYGATSSMYPSGVYQTRDGGRSWQPVACDTAGEWLAGDFGAVLSASGVEAVRINVRAASIH